MERDSLPNQRKVVWCGGKQMQIALAEGGGHIAALRFPGMGEFANPYWQPPWPSLEPEVVTQAVIEEEYGGNPEGRLLASILGHSLALDLYGPPSKSEEAFGAITHGRVGVQRWSWRVESENDVSGDCRDVAAQLQFSRRVVVIGCCALIEEKVQNLCAWDRLFAWQQHVSFGPPFCEDGFWAWANCDRGCTHPESFGAGASLIPNTETQWPFAPRKDGSRCDYRQPLGQRTANDFAGFRIIPSEQLGGFVAGNHNLGFALFYLWPRPFFPWLGVWDEKHARDSMPWRKNASVRAYEFGASPYPDTRRGFVRRPLLFDTPTLMFLPAMGILWVRYALGVFPGIAEAGELSYSASVAKLVTEGREIGAVPLPEPCSCSVREDMI